MDSELMTVARRLAERGWLPDLWIDKDGHLAFRLFDPAIRPPTEAILHLSAMRQVRKIGGTVSFGTLWVTLWVSDPEGIRKTTIYEQPAAQGDTPALLRCLLAACEAQETTNGSRLSFHRSKCCVRALPTTFALGGSSTTRTTATTASGRRSLSRCTTATTSRRTRPRTDAGTDSVGPSCESATRKTHEQLATDRDGTEGRHEDRRVGWAYDFDSRGMMYVYVEAY